MAEQRSAFGIDLGTTNSCISRFVDGGFRVVPIDGQATVPSVVAWDHGKWLIGRRALNHALVAPLSAVRSVKRHMGELSYSVTLGEERLSPVDVSTKILRYLKDSAEAAIQEEVREVVITVPAWFNDPQRRATIAAGEQAGLKVSRIINEPTAAALAFTAAERGRGNASGGEHWAVYDLGGGTFDISILSVSGPYKEVLASSGNTFLGGDDFDHRLASYLVDHLKDRLGIDVGSDPVAVAHLRHAAEAAKIRLSTEVETNVHEILHLGGREVELKLDLTRTQFNEMISDYVESTLVKAREALGEAKLTTRDLTRLLLVGGSTRIPLVQQRVAETLGLEPQSYVDVDLSVALGASVQAALDLGHTSSQIVVDVAPHGLGVATLGEEDQRYFAEDDALRDHVFGNNALGERETDPLTFAPIIRKNTRLPAKFVEEFFTVVEDQREIRVAVYQGESRLTRDNTFVGSFMTALPSGLPAGSPVHIGFHYDTSGVFQVSVSGKGASAPLKNYSMDLARSAQANSEVIVTDPAEKEVGATHAAAVNYLVEKVDRRLAAAPKDAFPDIRILLATYRRMLADEDDDGLDDAEERLYEWLDSQEAPGGEERAPPVG